MRPRYSTKGVEISNPAGNAAEPGRAGSRPEPMTHEGASGRGATSGNERLLLRREEDESGGQSEEPAEDAGAADERVLFSRRHEHGAIGDERQTKEGLVVPERPEQNPIVFRAVTLEELEEPRRLGTVFPEPSFLFGLGRRAAEDELADLGKLVQRSGPHDGKPAHRQGSDLGQPRRDTRSAR